MIWLLLLAWNLNVQQVDCHGHRYELEITNIDDIVEAHVDSQLIAKAWWGHYGNAVNRKPGSPRRIGHRPGALGRIDITPYIKEGGSTLTITTYNRAGCCAWRMSGTLYQDGHPIWGESFAEGNSKRAKYTYEIPLKQKSCAKAEPPKLFTAPTG